MYNKKIFLKSFAKINLSLLIKGKRLDNYHNLDMVMQSINLYDEVSISLNDESKINIFCDKNDIPLDENNLVYKASKAFFDFLHLKNIGVNINLKKNIPHGAGLAGGSSNASAILYGLNYLINSKLSIPDILNISKTIGSDVSFCSIGGLCRVQGKGEIITSLKTDCKLFFIIVKPNINIYTKNAFKQFSLTQKYSSNNNDDLVNFIISNDFVNIEKNLINDFEKITSETILKVKEDLINCGATNSLMTGTGSSVFSVFNDYYKSLDCYKSIKKIYKQSFLVEPVNYGVKLM